MAQDPRFPCPFYGRSLLDLSDHEGQYGVIAIVQQRGNRCALILDAHSPCKMTMENSLPFWGACERNPANNGTYKINILPV